MINFWQGLGGRLADQWAITVLTPAFLFWVGGFLAFITHFGWASLIPLEVQFAHLTSIEQIFYLIGGLLIIGVSSTVVWRLDLTMLRWLEGYWPRWLNWLSRQLVYLQYKAIEKAKNRLNYLSIKEERNNLSSKEYKERVALDLKLRQTPQQPRDFMPTRLGNVLRAAENRPIYKYGLDTIICWPRLWLLLPDSDQKELTEARDSLDAAARIFLWSIIFLIWTLLAWWVPIVTLVVAFWAYRWALSAAEVYGDLLESVFDLHHFALYEALHWPIPTDTSQEESKGKELTNYLFRGLFTETVVYQKTEDKDKSH